MFLTLKSSRLTTFLVLLLFFLTLLITFSPTWATTYIKLIPSGNGYQYYVIDKDNPVGDTGNSVRINIPNASNTNGSGSSGGGTSNSLPTPASNSQTTYYTYTIQYSNGSYKVTVKTTNTGNAYVFKSPYSYQPVTPPENNPANPQPLANLPIQLAPQPSPGGETSGLIADEQTLVNLINQERVAVGLHPLTVDMRLVRLARMKSLDMVNNNYFSHQSPTYDSPFDMMRSAGISYRFAGENIAGNSTVEGAHYRLMQSPGHRANILNPNFSHIGVGIASSSPYGLIITEMFIG